MSAAKTVVEAREALSAAEAEYNAVSRRDRHEVIEKGEWSRAALKVAAATDALIAAARAEGHAAGRAEALEEAEAVLTATHGKGHVCTVTIRALPTVKP